MISQEDAEDLQLGKRILDHLATVATTAGVLLFGVALGVKLAAVRTAPKLPQPEFGTSPLAADLATVYNGLIADALLGAGLLLLVGIALSLREELVTNVGEDLERLAEIAPDEEDQ